MFFLSNQVAVVKELLEEEDVFELSIRPKRSALQSKKEKLENEAIELSLNLRDRKRQLEEDKSSIIKLKQNLQKNNEKFLMQKHYFKV